MSPSSSLTGSHSEDAGVAAPYEVCCSVLQYVAVCCSALQCVAGSISSGSIGVSVIYMFPSGARDL